MPIEPELLKTEAALAASRHTGNMTAWDLVRQGTWRFHQVTRATHLQARELFREACRVDPQLPEAHIWLARVSAGILAYGWSEDPTADRQEGLTAAYAGIRLDDRNPYSHYGLAIISVYGGELQQAVRAAEKAVELSPSFGFAVRPEKHCDFLKGFGKGNTPGQFETSVRELATAMRASRAPSSFGPRSSRFKVFEPGGG